MFGANPMNDDKTKQAFAGVPVVLQALSGNSDAMLALAVIMQASREAGYEDGFSDGQKAISKPS